jgi:hypothetical protein
MAWIPAFLTFAGVSKSGSSVLNPITAIPSAFIFLYAASRAKAAAA